MTSIAGLMKEYFDARDSAGPSGDRELFSGGLIAEQKLPIRPSKIKWTIKEEPERFVREFEFANSRRLHDFVSEVLSYENEKNHSAKIIIESGSVIISVYTHTVNAITELDVEYTKAVKRIFRDVKDFKYE